MNGDAWKCTDTNRELREAIAGIAEDNRQRVMLFDQPPFDSAILGYAEGTDGVTRLVYSYDKMLESLMTHEGMSIEDASDFLGSDTLSQAPNAGIIVLHSIEV